MTAGATPRAAGGRVAGVVPAAGASARMGSPKALLRLEGSSFLRRVVDALECAGCDPVVVVAAADDSEVLAEARASGAHVLPNLDPGEGPVTSLRLALAHLAGDVDGVLWMPVDHPAVQPQTARAVLDAARAAGADLALPVYRGERGHPAYLGAALFDELTDPRLEGGARTVVHRHLDRATLVEVYDAGVTMDVDTPNDYKALVGGRAEAARAAPEPDAGPTARERTRRRPAGRRETEP